MDQQLKLKEQYITDINDDIYYLTDDRWTSSLRSST